MKQYEQKYDFINKALLREHSTDYRNDQVGSPDDSS